MNGPNLIEQHLEHAICEKRTFVQEFAYKGDVFTVYDDASTHEQAVEKCKCRTEPPQTLAIIENNDVFKYLEDKLSNLQPDKKDWRVGLKKEDEIYKWINGHILSKTLKNRTLSGEAKCISIKISNESGFLSPMNCCEAYNVSGYICSYKNASYLPKTFNTPKTLFESNTLGFENSDFTTTSTTEHSITITTLNFKTGDEIYNSTEGLSVWMLVLIILGCIMLVAVIILIFMKMRKKNNGREVTLGQVTVNQCGNIPRPNSLHKRENMTESSEVGYVSVDVFQNPNRYTRARAGQEHNQGTIPVNVQDHTSEITDTYAVVNKQKRNQGAQSSYQAGEATYAVVNKRKS